jgi:hypothetical protein
MGKNAWYRTPRYCLFNLKQLYLLFINCNDKALCYWQRHVLWQPTEYVKRTQHDIKLCGLVKQRNESNNSRQILNFYTLFSEVKFYPVVKFYKYLLWLYSSPSSLWTHSPVPCQKYLLKYISNLNPNGTVM